MVTLAITAWQGLRNDVAPERMEPGDMVAGLNVLLLDDGRLSRRMGTLMQVGPITGGRLHSLWSDGLTLGFCAKGRILQRVDPVSLALSPVAALHSDAPVSYASLGEIAYYTNGTDTGIVQEGRRRSWGLVVPSVPAAMATPGALPAGTYLYAMTYIREDGQESGAREVGSTTLTSPGGIYWPVLPASSDPSVAAKALYLSAPNGEVLYRALVLQGDVGSANYAGGSGSLSYPLETLHMGPAPAGQVIAWFQGRMWVARDDHVFASQPFSPELFHLQDYVPARGKVTMLAPRPDDKAMLIGTTAGVGWMQGEQFPSLEYLHALDDPVLPGSLLMVPGAHFGDGSAGQTHVPVWAGARGLYAAAPPYWQVQPITLDRMHLDLRGRVAAVFDRLRGQYLATIAT